MDSITETADKPKLRYTIKVPGVVNRPENSPEIAYSERQALSGAIMQESKRKEHFYWNNQTYSGDIGARSLINDILDSPYLFQYVQKIEDPVQPKVLELPKKPEQMELDLSAAVLEEWKDDRAYSSISSGEYSPDEWYELSVTWPATGRKMTYTADNEEQYLHLVDVAKKGYEQKAPAVLRIHQRQRRSLRWEKYKNISAELIVRAKSDPKVLALLNKYEKGPEVFDEIDILVSPYLKEGSGRFDEEPNQIRIGYSENEGTMYDVLVHYLSIVMNKKLAPSDNQTWRVLQRPYMMKGIADTIQTFKEQGKSEDEIVRWLTQSYGNIGMTEEMARDLISKSAQLVESCRINQAVSDSILWKKGRVSVRAIDQFRKFADIELQATVEEMLACNCLKEAIELIKPYMAYRVQAGSPDGAKTIAIDFDGVLAQTNEDDPSRVGPPLPGAIDALHQLVNAGWRIAILSSRARTMEGEEDIKNWLDVNGAPDVVVTSTKIPSDLYIDDRAYQFTNWSDDLSRILTDERATCLTCQDDESALEWKEASRQWECPACDSERDISSMASVVIYAFGSGDKVTVQSVEGTTLGDAHLLYRASPGEERVLKASNLWLAYFPDGRYLPVGEQQLTKIGFDEVVRHMAADILDGRELFKVEVGEEAKVKYDLDKVIEAVLIEAREGHLPTDTILVTAGTKYSLSAEDLDMVAQHLLELKQVRAAGAPGKEITPSHEDLTNATRDAIEEADAFFSDQGISPTESDEESMVMGYLAEEFGWTKELLDDKIMDRVRELIKECREGSMSTVGFLKAPRWITSTEDKELWDKAVERVGDGAGYGAAINVFRAYKARQQEEKPEEKKEAGSEKVIDRYKGYTILQTDDYGRPPIVVKRDGKVVKRFDSYDSAVEYIDGKKTADDGHYLPVDMPSLTSSPEDEYDRVRFQTVSAGSTAGYWVSTKLVFDEVGDPIEPTEGDKLARANGFGYVEQLIKAYPNKWIEVDDKSKIIKVVDEKDMPKADETSKKTALPNEQDYRGTDVDNVQASHDPKVKKCPGCGCAMASADSSPSGEICTSCKAKSAATKKAVLDKAITNLQLDDSQLKIVAGIVDDLDSYSTHFLERMGQFFTYEWDPGASWELKDIKGKKQIVRKEVEKKETKQGSHQFKVGQLLKLCGIAFPIDVRVIETLGTDRYKVKSQLDSRVVDVDEDELMLPEQDVQIFH